MSQQQQQKNRSETISQTNSVSSTSSEITAEKYHRLANEYAKIRQKFLILKKTMIDDELKQNEQIEQIKLKEQIIQKLEQEIDNLEFRNKQLTKRINLLQNDLDNFRLNNNENQKQKRFLLFLKNSKNNEQQQQSEELNDNSIIIELNMKLKEKIEQFEQLKQSYSDNEENYRKQIEQLQYELKMIRNSTKEIDDKVKNERKQSDNFLKNKEKIDYKHLYNKLSKDYNELNLMMQNLKIQNQNYSERIYNLEQLSPINNDINFLRKKQQYLQKSTGQNYNDINKRNEILNELLKKLCEFFASISILHSNISQKISILFACFQKQSNHLYFIDYYHFIKNSNDSDNDYRSLSVMSILRKFRDYLMQNGYNQYLVQLEDSSKQFIELKLQQWKCLQQPNQSLNELIMIEQQLSKTSIDIVETFVDYVNYLNKMNIYLTACLNLWCKQLMDYDRKNLIVKNLLDQQLQQQLSELDKRLNVCEKNELLIKSITNVITIVGQLCTLIQLLLSKSKLPKTSSNFLTIFNKLIHSIVALENGVNETKQLFSSKVVLEHDLGITVEMELKSADDCLLSSMVFLSKCIHELRLLFEMHYFFFVNDYHQQSVNTSDDDIRLLNSIDDDKTMKPKQCQNCLQQQLQQDNKDNKDKCSIEIQLMKMKLEREKKRSNELEQKCQLLIEQLQEYYQLKEQKQQTQHSMNEKLQNSNLFIEEDSIKLSKNKSTNNNSNLLNSLSESKSLIDHHHHHLMMKKQSSETILLYAELGSTNSSIIQSSSINQSIDNFNIDCDDGRNFKTNQQQSIVDKFELLDSLSKTYEQDCYSLRQRLLMEQKNFSDKNSLMINKQSEQQLIIENYEQQLQTMSEHMAKLNERLAEQCEQIDLLNYNKNLNNGNDNSLINNSNVQRKF